MAKALTQTGSVGLAQSAAQLAKFGVLRGSEIIILAIKPSLCYVLFVSSRWLAILLPIGMMSWLSGQLGWLGMQAQALLAMCLAGMFMRLAFGLLQRTESRGTAPGGLKKLSRATVAVAGLPLGVRVEIEAVATR